MNAARIRARAAVAIASACSRLRRTGCPAISSNRDGRLNRVRLAFAWWHPDSDLYAESSDADTVMGYITAHA